MSETKPDPNDLTIAENAMRVAEKLKEGTSGDESKETDFQKVTHKMSEVGADLLKTIWNFDIMGVQSQASFYDVNGHGVVVVANLETGDPVEEDLKFIEQLAAL